jgi:hypothetical protein
MSQSSRSVGSRAALSTRQVLFRAMAVMTVTIVGLAGIEILIRVLDGYRLGSFLLVPSRGAGRNIVSIPLKAAEKLKGDDDPLPYVQQLPVAPGVDREWFTTRFPQRTQDQPNPDLAARSGRYSDIHDMRPNYEWNWKFATGAVCRDSHGEEAEIFNHVDDIFVFDPTDGSESPTYRFLRNASYPSGLKTNGYGWRGPDVPFHKPSNTIRIGFVGASTTVGAHQEPYAYPELVGLWLNQWASRNHPRLLFDVVNAGREGVNSRSIQAIVRQEVLPLEPDLVVYYEGANQFWPANFIWTQLPARSRQSAPPPTALAYYSAACRRFESLVRRAVAPGLEPVKPHIEVNWPADLDERDPDLAHRQLPVELPRILSDLETIRRSLDEQGSKLVVTSFVWLVHPGLALDPARDAELFSYLNTTYWPFSYAHMRRLVDFENRVFQKYASTHDLDFIDMASTYPRDPRLFDDAVHMTHAGIRLQAWMAFNGLIPAVEREIAAGRLPRPASGRWAEHPAFAGHRRLVPTSDLRAACGATSPASSAK